MNIQGFLNLRHGSPIWPTDMRSTCGSHLTCLVYCWRYMQGQCGLLDIMAPYRQVLLMVSVCGGTMSAWYQIMVT